MKRWNSEVIGSLFWIAVALFFCVGAMKMNLGSLQNPGPGYIPLGMSLLLLCFSLFTLVRGLIASNRRDQLNPVETARAGDGFCGPLRFPYFEGRLSYFHLCRDDYPVWTPHPGEKEEMAERFYLFCCHSRRRLAGLFCGAACTVPLNEPGDPLELRNGVFQ